MHHEDLGRANSINVMKVLWCADECGLKYEREDVGGAFGGSDQKWYLDMNPNGVVPTIDEGGRIVWESNSAVRAISLPSTPRVACGPRSRACAARPTAGWTGSSAPSPSRCASPSGA